MLHVHLAVRFGLSLSYQYWKY